MHKSGLYLLEIHGRYYGGSSKSLIRRKWKHITDLRNGLHPNRRLQNLWNKYGADALVFRPLLFVDVPQLELFEQRWLDHHFGQENCINDLPTAGCPSRGKPLSSAHKEKIRQALLGVSHTSERIEKVRLARQKQTNINWVPKGSIHHSRLMKEIMNNLPTEKKEEMHLTRWTPEKREEQRQRMIQLNKNRV